MIDRIIFSLFCLPFVAWGILGILKPEIMYKTTAINTLKKVPKKNDIKRYRVSGYVMLIFGVVLIIVILIGGFKEI
jgi:hypothetical protein